MKNCTNPVFESHGFVNNLENKTVSPCQNAAGANPYLVHWFLTDINLCMRSYFFNRTQQAYLFIHIIHYFLLTVKYTLFFYLQIWILNFALKRNSLILSFICCKPILQSAIRRFLKYDFMPSSLWVEVCDILTCINLKWMAYFRHHHLTFYLKNEIPREY